MAEDLHPSVRACEGVIDYGQIAGAAEIYGGFGLEVIAGYQHRSETLGRHVNAVSANHDLVVGDLKSVVCCAVDPEVQLGRDLQNVVTERYVVFVTVDLDEA